MFRSAKSDKGFDLGAAFKIILVVVLIGGAILLFGSVFLDWDVIGYFSDLTSGVGGGGGGGGGRAAAASSSGGGDMLGGMGGILILALVGLLVWFLIKKIREKKADVTPEPGEGTGAGRIGVEEPTPEPVPEEERAKVIVIVKDGDTGIPSDVVKLQVNRIGTGKLRKKEIKLNEEIKFNAASGEKYSFFAFAEQAGKVVKESSKIEGPVKDKQRIELVLQKKVNGGGEPVPPVRAVGTIRGAVIWKESRQPAPGALVEMTCIAGNKQKVREQFKADAEGKFIINDRAIQNDGGDVYKFRAYAENKPGETLKSKKKEVKLEPGQTVDVLLALSKEAGILDRGEKAAVESRSTGGNITIENKPVIKINVSVDSNGKVHVTEDDGNGNGNNGGGGENPPKPDLGTELVSSVEKYRKGLETPEEKIGPKDTHKVKVLIGKLNKTGIAKYEFIREPKNNQLKIMYSEDGETTRTGSKTEFNSDERGYVIVLDYPNVHNEVYMQTKLGDIKVKLNEVYTLIERCAGISMKTGGKLAIFTKLKGIVAGKKYKEAREAELKKAVKWRTEITLYKIAKELYSRKGRYAGVVTEYDQKYQQQNE